MRKCSQCKRTYADESFSFCLEDGALLSASYDPRATLVIPAAINSDSTTTERVGPILTPAPSSDEKKKVRTSKTWNEQRFFADASARLSAEHLQSLRSLFEWAKANADNHDPSFGRGVIGSFNPKIRTVSRRSNEP